MKKAALHTFDTCVSMLSEESNQRPKFLTVLDGFTNELPTFMLVTKTYPAVSRLLLQMSATNNIKYSNLITIKQEPF